MPNPILVVNPGPRSTTPKYEVGQILVRAWGTSKVAKNRVVRVTKVNKILLGTMGHRYSYDVEFSSGDVDLGVSHFKYITFDAHRKKIQERIQATYRTIANQEKEYQASLRMEEDAKKLLQK